MRASAVLCAAVLCTVFVSALEDKHSLYYLYTVQSKRSASNVYEFSAVTLDDRQIDSYSSTDGVRTPKQDWMKEMTESERESGTAEMKDDATWSTTFLGTVMEAFGHSESGGHTLQWRHGCEGVKRFDGSVMGVNYTDEYAYDGQDFIHFNWTLKKWLASAEEGRVMEERWNTGHGHITALQKCEEWLKIYLHYKNNTQTKPGNVFVFAKKSVTGLINLTLTCLATGFYLKDMKIELRKFTTSLPEHLLTSSGVRPNEDGTYQLRKSVEIQEDEPADYDCYVTHSSINTPVIKQWDGKYNDCTNDSSLSSTLIVVFSVIAVVLLVTLVICFCKRNGVI
ncbi:H-2 class I histocompatibility antigen, alpha chain-like [Colossoma macropomum]|uniref:H-2 class I histocompatibility antigen, alpha chain-like n=1 Tax=Colossoma macropomum TaxID=42526 RepID=UPI001864A095|nr:H-2 class I histocompatibility antigen, alpha chain-like [Colossoma macropomum]